MISVLTLVFPLLVYFVYFISWSLFAFIFLTLTVHLKYSLDIGGPTKIWTSWTSLLQLGAIRGQRCDWLIGAASGCDWLWVNADTPIGCVVKMLWLTQQYFWNTKKWTEWFHLFAVSQISTQRIQVIRGVYHQSLWTT